jgi:hypothetical protein
MGMGMSTGMGGLQSLISQLGGQGASGNPYVSPALGGGGEKIPQAGTAMARSYAGTPATWEEYQKNQGLYMTHDMKPWQSGEYSGMDSKTAYESWAAKENANPSTRYIGTPNTPNMGGLQGALSGNNLGNSGPTQQLGAVNATYTPAGSGAGLSSLVSGSSGSLNSMPSMSGAGGAGGAGGSGGPFPLEGKYGIIKMANGGLANAAQNMAGQGRDGDSMLVHMSPGEVKGLQALAMAHGGSLSINPDTGLVEASF